jgi:single-strand DNA-binding protein
VNSVILTGVAATEPEMRYTPNGKAVTSFRIAVPSGRKGKNGQELSDYFTVVSWTDLAEKLGADLRKGGRVFVQGRLQNESWTDQASGKKRYVTKVTASSVEIWGGSSEQQEESHEVSEPREVDPDDIPF